MTSIIDNELNSNQNGEKSSVSAIVIRYALISTLLGAAYAMLLFVANKHFSMIGMLALIIPVTLVFMAINQYKKENGGYITFGKAFTIGILFFLLTGVLSWGFNHLYTNFIVPDYWEGLVDKMEVTFEKFGMSDEQIEISLDKMIKNKSNIGKQFLNSVLTFGFLGLVFSAIAGAALKKEEKLI